MIFFCQFDRFIPYIQLIFKKGDLFNCVFSIGETGLHHSLFRHIHILDKTSFILVCYWFIQKITSTNLVMMIIFSFCWENVFYPILDESYSSRWLTLSSSSKYSSKTGGSPKTHTRPSRTSWRERWQENDCIFENISQSCTHQHIYIAKCILDYTYLEPLIWDWNTWMCIYDMFIEYRLLVKVFWSLIYGSVEWDQ